MEIDMRLWLLSGLLVGVATLNAGSFFIKKSNSEQAGTGWSRSQVCEELGTNIKDLFTESVAMVQEIATMQTVMAQASCSAADACALMQTNGKLLQELAGVQKLCTRVLEALLDEHRVFKKSDRLVLEATHATMRSCFDELVKQREQVKRCVGLTEQKKTKATDTITRQIATTIESCLLVVGKQAQRLRDDACIKKI
jgi:hypothetical protein